LIANQVAFGGAERIDCARIGGQETAMTNPPTRMRAKASTPGMRAASVDRPGGAVDETALGVLDGFIGFHLRLAQDASFRGFAQRAGRHDLKPGRFAAMMVIHNNPGINQTALGRAVARDKSTITPLLQGLERQGLIERRAPANDGRSFVLNLTAAGEAMVRELLARAREHERKLDDIAGAGKEAFVRVLRRIAQELK
jgi:DNA-binding MarR family transcriptional regulator